MKIDYDILRKVCRQSVKSFQSYGQTFDDGWSGDYIYHSRPENKVLAVAHRDHVMPRKSFEVVNTKKFGKVIFNGALDDRLGIYILAHLIPDALSPLRPSPLPYDLLLTDGEESGMSTASDFVPDKQYNWIFSFDRAGDDVVMYQYDTPAARALLTEHGLTPGRGSFSDISSLDHLGATGFNFGTGYYNEHTPRHFAVESTILSQVRKFISFFNAYKDTPLPYDAPAPTPGRYTRGDSYAYDDYCELCGLPAPALYPTAHGYLACVSCVNNLSGDPQPCAACGKLFAQWDLYDGCLCGRCSDAERYY